MVLVMFNLTQWSTQESPETAQDGQGNPRWGYGDGGKCLFFDLGNDQGDQLSFLIFLQVAVKMFKQIPVWKLTPEVY